MQFLENSHRIRISQTLATPKSTKMNDLISEMQNKGLSLGQAMARSALLGLAMSVLYKFYPDNLSKEVA